MLFIPVSLLTSDISKLKQLKCIIMSVVLEFRNGWLVVLAQIFNKAAVKTMLGSSHLKA